MLYLPRVLPFIAAIVFIVVILCAFPLSLNSDVSTTRLDVLVDPGHGGEDGGTVASDGTLEKNINLAIGLDLYELFLVCGYSVEMTRDTDVSIHDPDCISTRDMKVSDMHNRLALYDEANTVISIHQNHYSVPKYAGAQVFYSANQKDGEQLAQSVQQSIVSCVQPGNNRQIKPATDGIYLLHHTTSRAILVECGFLSNPDERDALKNKEYQQRIAFCIFLGYINAENN